MEIDGGLKTFIWFTDIDHNSTFWFNAQGGDFPYFDSLEQFQAFENLAGISRLRPGELSQPIDPNTGYWIGYDNIPFSYFSSATTTDDDIVTLNNFNNGIQPLSYESGHDPQEYNSYHVGAGDDIIYGLGGVDALAGDAGNDQLFGGADNDFLFGGAGDDILDGGSGANNLNGGAGADVFIFADITAENLIQDFESGSDQIDFKQLTQQVETITITIDGVQVHRSSCDTTVDASLAELRFSFEQNGTDTDLFVSQVGFSNPATTPAQLGVLQSFDASSLYFDDILF